MAAALPVPSRPSRMRAHIDFNDATESTRLHFPAPALLPLLRVFLLYTDPRVACAVPLMRILLAPACRPRRNVAIVLHRAKQRCLPGCSD